MGEKLKIKEAAKERGMTLAFIAKKLGIYRSNMSAIASGARGVSLKILKKICITLDCSIDELVSSEKSASVFRNKTLRSRLYTLEKLSHDGSDKTWVDRLVLAGKSHYRSARKA